eukprot:symbB.v1.2.004126.t1/scaffold232.1/size259024/3
MASKSHFTSAKTLYIRAGWSPVPEKPPEHRDDQLPRDAAFTHVMLVTLSNLQGGAWNLTDQDGVDELVHLFELDERPLRPSMWGDRMSRMTRLSSRPSVASNAQLSKISEEV